MKQLVIMLVKFISCYIAFAVGLDLFFNADMLEIASFSLVLTIVSYFIGDRILLPRIGNINALVVDFFLAYSAVWLFGPTVLNSYLQIAWGSIISAIIVSVAEVFVHRFLQNKMEQNQMRQRQQRGVNPKFAYGVEAAEEQDPLKDQQK